MNCFIQLCCTAQAPDVPEPITASGAAPAAVPISISIGSVGEAFNNHTKKCAKTTVVAANEEPIHQQPSGGKRAQFNFLLLL
jgi:hypothetical protein